MDHNGLIAGTTGSGKSETIQSYILSLAVNFHPHDVAFLPHRLQGWGMANLFKDLPHLLGDHHQLGWCPVYAGIGLYQCGRSIVGAALWPIWGQPYQPISKEI